MAQRGGLLELVARGKKDLFFQSNPSVSYFHSVYRRVAPFVEEVYVSQPKNAPEWGKWLEFDLEHRGDLIRKLYLRVTLPTWLPETYAAVNKKTVITDTSGVAFGYTNNIGFQMIEKIQLFQDQVLIQELYGEYLDWRLRQLNSLATTYVIAASVGARGDTSLEIGRSATPGHLRIPIPLIGWENVGDSGFPMAAMRKQRFRLRILLRNVENVVVASDTRLNPNPWNKAFQIRRSPTAAPEVFTTLGKHAMRQIQVSLETTQVYVQKDIQEWLRIQEWRIPYRQAQYQAFTIEDNQWNAASSVASFSLPFRLDFVGPANRLLMGFQQEGDRLSGWNSLLERPVNQLRLNIANIDRIQSFPPEVFQDVTSYWKNQRAAQNQANLDKPHAVFTMTFGGKDSRQPAGTLNFTRSTPPELWATLASIPIHSRTRSRKAFLHVYAESWKIWQIREEKGMCMVDE
jgi:hypothetical protein